MTSAKGPLACWAASAVLPSAMAMDEGSAKDSANKSSGGIPSMLLNTPYTPRRDPRLPATEGDDDVKRSGKQSRVKCTSSSTYRQHSEQHKVGMNMNSQLAQNLRGLDTQTTLLLSALSFLETRAGRSVSHKIILTRKSRCAEILISYSNINAPQRKTRRGLNRPVACLVACWHQHCSACLMHS